MKTYKHKLTGDIIHEWKTTSGYLCYKTEEEWIIPAKYVENNEDWEEINKALFFSDDPNSVPIFVGDSFWFVRSPLKGYFFCKHAKKEFTKAPTNKYFTSEENAKKYVEDSISQYTLRDMRDCFHHGRIHGPSGCSFETYIGWINRKS